MKVMGIICSKCDDLIYSRTSYDFRKCSCESCSVDGGRERFKISFIPEIPAKKVSIELPFTKEELFSDYNEEIDSLGLIKPVKGTKAHTKVLIEATKKALAANKKVKASELVSLFSNQLKRLQQNYARLCLKSK